MLSYLNGQVKIINEKSVIIEIAGVGFEVFASVLLLEKLKLGQPIQLFTYLNVREDALELFGFNSIPELTFFKQLIGVSGVGPKSALTIMSLAPMEDLKKGILQGEATLLTKVSGIGKKTAERLIVELKSKLEKSGADGFSEAGSTADSQAIDGLMALGYSAPEAREALRAVDKNVTSTQDRVRAVLKMMGKGK